MVVPQEVPSHAAHEIVLRAQRRGVERNRDIGRRGRLLGPIGQIAADSAGFPRGRLSSTTNSATFQPHTRRTRRQIASIAGPRQCLGNRRKPGRSLKPCGLQNP